MNYPDTFWQRAEAFPPILCRVLARRHNYGRPKAIPLEELATLAQIPPITLQAISVQTDWSGIDLPTMQRYLKACGLDFENATQMKRLQGFLYTNPSFQYLRDSNEWTQTYLPLLTKWRRSLGPEPSKTLWQPLRNLAVRLTPLCRSTTGGLLTGR